VLFGHTQAEQSIRVYNPLQGYIPANNPAQTSENTPVWQKRDHQRVHQGG
jgi:hypothetical protein